MRLFAFRLALSLGCTVKELSHCMDKEEFLEWIAYYNIEPWGSLVDGYRNASTVAMVANASLATNNPKRLRSRPYKLDDFLIGVDNRKPKSSRDNINTIKETLMAMAKNRQEHE